MIRNTVSFSKQMTGPADCGNVGISEILFRNAAAWEPVNTTDNGRVDGFIGDEDPYPVIATMPVEGMARLELVRVVRIHNAAPRATTTATTRSNRGLRNLLLTLTGNDSIERDHMGTARSMCG